MRSDCNEFPRGCNNGIFTAFDRRNKSTKQSILDGNNGNRIEGEKKVVSALCERLFLFPPDAHVQFKLLCANLFCYSTER